MHYGSAESVVNGYYNSHPVHLILSTKFLSETAISPYQEEEELRNFS